MYSIMPSGENAVNATSTLPIIDIAPWVNGHDHNDSDRLSTAAAIHDACLEYGFFYLDTTPFVAPEEPEELSRLAHEFFQLPQEEKDKISLNKQDRARGAPQSQMLSSFVDLCSLLGYQRLKENVTLGLADSQEAIDFYHPVENPDRRKLLWGENQWPSIPGFREKYEAWINKMKALGFIVMHAWVSS
jgi:isopenicillin N synthase-like dioxygenase